MSSLIPQSNQLPSTHVDASPASGQPGGGLQIPKIAFKEVFNAALRWCWIPVFFVLLGVVAMRFYVSSKPEFYTAQGAIYIKRSAPQIFSGNPLAQDESNDLEQMKTVEQGLLSSTVLLRVAKKNNLASDPLFQVHGVEDQALLHTLEQRVSVELRKGTRLMDIRVEDTSAERAAKLVEDIVTEYEIWKDQRRSELIEKTSVGLASEEQRMRTKMEASEKRMLDFRKKHPVLGLSGNQGTQQSTTLEMLKQELSAATAERLRLKAQSQSIISGEGGDQSPTLAARGERGVLALDLESQIATKEAEFSKIKERYLYRHPKFIEAKQELQRLSEQLVSLTTKAEEAFSNDLNISRAREEELQQLVDEAKVEEMNDEALREQFAQLARAAEIDRGLHLQVATTLQETKIGEALNYSFLRWDDRPITPIWPSGPNRKAYVLFGLFLGAVVGLFIALLLTISDPRVREPTAVERKLRLPMLARIPAYNHQVVQDLSVYGDSVEALSRPAHLTRYTPAPQEGAERMQTLLFASPFDGDGKSLCAMKCARTMVKQGYRTLVVDADFSETGLSRDYSAQRGDRHGLAAYLRGEAEAAEVLYETGLPGLWFLPTGAIAGDNGDLLSGPGLQKLLSAITPMFDRVIFDMSSVLESDDVQAVVRHVSATYLVAQKGKGRYRHLKEVYEILQSSGGKITGFIWNDGGRSRRSDQGPVIEPIAYAPEVREVFSKEQDQPMPAPVPEQQMVQQQAI